MAAGNYTARIVTGTESDELGQLIGLTTPLAAHLNRRTQASENGSSTPAQLQTPLAVLAGPD